MVWLKMYEKHCIMYKLNVIGTKCKSAQRTNEKKRKSESEKKNCTRLPNVIIVCRFAAFGPSTIVQKWGSFPVAFSKHSVQNPKKKNIQEPLRSFAMNECLTVMKKEKKNKKKTANDKTYFWAIMHRIKAILWISFRRLFSLLSISQYHHFCIILFIRARIVFFSLSLSI